MLTPPPTAAPPNQSLWHILTTLDTSSPPPCSRTHSASATNVWPCCADGEDKPVDPDAEEGEGEEGEESEYETDTDDEDAVIEEVKPDPEPDPEPELAEEPLDLRYWMIMSIESRLKLTNPPPTDVAMYVGSRKMSTPMFEIMLLPRILLLLRPCLRCPPPPPPPPPLSAIHPIFR